MKTLKKSLLFNCLFIVLIILTNSNIVLSQDTNICNTNITKTLFKTVYFNELDIRNPCIYTVLDSALSLNKHFDFNKDSVDYYYQLEIRPSYEKVRGMQDTINFGFIFYENQFEDTLHVILTLFQNDEYTGFYNSNPSLMNEYKGGFCYKEKMFLVYSWKTELESINSIFNITDDKIGLSRYMGTGVKRVKIPQGKEYVDCDDFKFVCYPTQYRYYFYYVNGKFIFREKFIKEHL